MQVELVQWPIYYDKKFQYAWQGICDIFILLFSFVFMYIARLNRRE